MTADSSCAEEVERSLPSSYLTATRWKSYLLSDSTAFRTLQEERERGWRSTVLDQWYAKRWSDSNNSAPSSLTDTTKPPKQLSAANALPSPNVSSVSNDSERQSADSPGSTRPHATFFNASYVNISELTARYASHARRTWASGPSAKIFSPHRAGSKRDRQTAYHKGLEAVKADKETVAVSNQAPPLNMRCALVNHSHVQLDDTKVSHPALDDDSNAACWRMPNLSFLDLGTAPGGVSHFLTKELGWNGVGVTLSPAQGGIAVFTGLIQHHLRSVCHLFSSPPPVISTGSDPGEGRATDRNKAADEASAVFLLFHGDVTAPEKCWTLCPPASPDADNSVTASVSSVLKGGGRVLTRDSPAAKVEGQAQNALTTTVSVPQQATTEKDEMVEEKWANNFRAINFHDLLGNCRFAFVHCGAVQDYGQRQHSVMEATTTASENRAFNSVNEPLDSVPQLLPWFTLLIPQLRLALRYVQHGGSFLLVYGAPHCSSFFVFLHLLQHALGPNVRIRIYETMHLGKTPVYVLCENVWTRKEHGTGCVETTHTWTRRQDELLQCMEPHSSLVCPTWIPSQERLQASTDTSDHKTEDVDSSVTRLHSEEKRRQKELFWLGESEDGWAAARAGFSAYRQDVERIWGKMRIFLQRRRERAEREVKAMNNHPER